MAAIYTGGFIATNHISTYFAFVRGDHAVKSAIRLLLLILFINTIEILKASTKGNTEKEGRKIC